MLTGMVSVRGIDRLMNSNKERIFFAGCEVPLWFDLIRLLPAERPFLEEKRNWKTDG